jgi:1,4-alpha-glucan branching enzyme
MTGYLSIVLHAHLPYVRHPEHPDFLEEERRTGSTKR